ncbi:MAG: ABC transporter ATP-binding protein [Actinobacteria bacterium]|nr:ABC transporter ATP-binding protein [Actinomycetota bacterium]NBR75939.1 ABC transporter ATP-binding protein [Actinomycetota bacterium]NBR92060.1 ABC transporter ATP-binding protein [Actinomycetota bacterium]NBT20884.1 ABC transporter ATP-binding protein [Actinomycetota bacterium]NBY57603.1 ABC transporter ATP-binding protein [Actinomycetota bacterium]
MKFELRGITKRFPGVVANDNVNLEVSTGEVLALIGENGAGKSTLMNVLYGIYRPDEGELRIDGTPQHFSSPADAIAAGIGMVHQHFMLVPVMTVAENVVLGVEPTGRLGSLDIDEARRMVKEVSDKYSLELNPDAVIEDLPVGVRQRVEIVKVLMRDAKIVVFDEPTAVLTPSEILEFFEIVRSLVAAGRGVIFITHKLKEALTIADRINVLRRGKVVGEANPKNTTESEIAEMMVGRAVQLVVDKKPATPGAAMLQVKNLSVVEPDGRTVVDDVSFEVRVGEIVGIAGVQGNGQTELVEALSGMRRAASGSISVADRDVSHDSPRERHAAGMAHIPEDRQRQGLVTEMSITENLVLTRYHDAEFSQGIRMKWDVAAARAKELVAAYDIRTNDPSQPASTLSGGNQQKVIVARELSRDIRLAVAAQPTRGIDVGSIEYVHSQIVKERDAGVAVLVVSTELDEIMSLSDRVLVMYRGRIVADLDPKKVSHMDIGLYMAGSRPAAVAS